MESANGCFVCKKSKYRAKNLGHWRIFMGGDICPECYEIVKNFVSEISMQDEDVDLKLEWPPAYMIKAAGNEAARLRQQYLIERANEKQDELGINKTTIEHHKEFIDAMKAVWEAINRINERIDGFEKKLWLRWMEEDKAG